MDELGGKAGRGSLWPLVISHALTVVGEWAAVIGVLVHAYDWGGTAAVGPVSVVLLAPAFAFAPMTASLTARYPAQRVRRAGFVAQAVGYGAAAVAAFADAPTPVVATGVVVGLGALTTLRPTGAELLPAIARSTDELLVGNLRISYCDSACGLVGPLVAAVLGAVSGPAAVLTACAAMSGGAVLMSTVRTAPIATPTTSARRTTRQQGVLRSVAGELRDRRWAVGVLGVSSGRDMVIGALDVVLVVLAFKALDLGDGGAGLLSAMVGAGALLSTGIATAAVRRSRLRLPLAVSLVVAAGLCLLMGVATDATVVFIALPALGICLSLMSNLSRMLLQRSTGPRSLGPLFAFLGLAGGVAQVVGAALAQVLLALWGVEVALVGVGVALAVIAAATFRPMRAADANADVPVVEMSLLAGIPLFAPLPAATLEAVARAAVAVHVADGEEIIRQGDAGDEFYAVVDGAFDIEMNGVFLRSAPRGDFFGEVALLSNMTRTATVRATETGSLLSIHRDPFLLAVTGHESAHGAALTYVDEMQLADKMRWTSEEAARRSES